MSLNQGIFPWWAWQPVGVDVYRARVEWGGAGAKGLGAMERLHGARLGCEVKGWDGRGMKMTFTSYVTKY
jgi:hypothetical protein